MKISKWWRKIENKKKLGMSKITKYEIDMLDVKAADAFLIYAYIDDGDGGEFEYVVLVDAGNEGDGEAIYNLINQYYDQTYIDLVIITHCDSDHYGGMQYLINKHKDPKILSRYVKSGYTILIIMSMLMMSNI